jgi:hypothetical protein
MDDRRSAHWMEIIFLWPANAPSRRSGIPSCNGSGFSSIVAQPLEEEEGGGELSALSFQLQAAVNPPDLITLNKCDKKILSEQSL